MVKKKDKYKKHIGKFPVNSRITIDYTGKKPSVKFAYPSKDDDSTFGTAAVFLPALLITIIIFCFVSFFGNSYNIHDYPEYCDIDVRQHTFNSTNTTEVYGIGATCLINNKTYDFISTFNSGKEVLWFRETAPTFYWEENTSDVFVDLLAVILMIPIFYIIAKLLTWIYKNTRWGNEKFPEWNKTLGGDARYSAIFKECPDTNTIELPLFKNIYMDYEAREEFGKYLERIEIREHPFNELIHKGSFRKKNRKTTKKKNIWLWKATFFFSKQPKKGQLEIRWT